MNTSTTYKSTTITYNNKTIEHMKARSKKKDDHKDIFSLLLEQTLLPIFLMTVCPNLVMVLWHTARYGMWQSFDFSYLAKIWSEVEIGSSVSITIILGYMLFSLVLMVLIPGPRFLGPETEKGNVPVYKDNGFYCYLVTIATLGGLEYYLYHEYDGVSITYVYDHFGDLLVTINMGTHLLCIFLVLKGYMMPSSTDSGTTGNPLFDYYWGTELYPRVFGVDIKVFTNCRFGMTIWSVLVLIFALKSYQLYGFIDSMWISCGLQMIYITKFFWWESGYMRTIDIMLDRAGFYICWGCLVFIPGLYASPSLYLVNNPVVLGQKVGLAVFSIGVLAIAVNYLADKQKIDVRNANGKCTVWGRPAKVIRARIEVNGVTKTSILLINGYWGISRHFHYIPELTLAAMWSIPAGFTNPLHYSYLIFLTGLLVHRTYRDDIKCSKKYHKYWQQYKSLVPYRMIPYVF